MGDDPIKLPRVPFRLREALAVPAGWPPDVAPNQIIAASHINRIRSTVYEWPGDVDAMWHTLRNVNIVGVTGVLADPMTAKGDIISRSDTAPVKVAVGTAGQVLTVDPAQPASLKWATPIGEVISFKGRKGAVDPLPGDYTASMVTNAVDMTQTYANPNWITALSWNVITQRPATFAPSPHTHDASDVVTGRLNTARLGTGLADASVYLRGDGSWQALNIPASPVISVFKRTGVVEAKTGDYTAAQVTGAVVDQTIARGDILVRNATEIMRLPAGANGTVLQSDNSQPSGLRWGLQSGGPGIPTGLTNGDIMQWTNGAWALLPVGATGQALMVDSGNAGLFWGTGAGGSQTPWLTDINGNTKALDNVGSIVCNGLIKSSMGGFMFPDGSVMTTSASQTPWATNIDGNSKTLSNVGLLRVRSGASGYTPDDATVPAFIESAEHNYLTVAAPAAKDVGVKLSHGSNVTASLIDVAGGSLELTAGNSQPLEVSVGNAKRIHIGVDGQVGIGNLDPDYVLDVSGDINYSGTLRLNGTPVSFGGSQTPWTSDIDAANHSLNNANRVNAKFLGAASALATTWDMMVLIDSTNPDAAIGAGIVRIQTPNQRGDNVLLNCVGGGATAFEVRANGSAYAYGPLTVPAGHVSIGGPTYHSNWSSWKSASSAHQYVIGPFYSVDNLDFVYTADGLASHTRSATIDPGGAWKFFQNVYIEQDIYIANSGGGATQFRIDGYMDRLHIVGQGGSPKVAIMTNAAIRMDVDDVQVNISTQLAIGGQPLGGSKLSVFAPDVGYDAVRVHGTNTAKYGLLHMDSSLNRFTVGCWAQTGWGTVNIPATLNVGGDVTAPSFGGYSIGGEGVSKIVTTNGAGHAYVPLLHMSYPTEDTLPIAAVYTNQGGDGFLRRTSLARFKSVLGGVYENTEPTFTGAYLINEGLHGLTIGRIKNTGGQYAGIYWEPGSGDSIRALNIYYAGIGNIIRIMADGTIRMRVDGVEGSLHKDAGNHLILGA